MKALLYKLGARIWYGLWASIAIILLVALVINVVSRLVGEPPYYHY